MIENEEISLSEFCSLSEDMQFKELYAYYGRIMYAYQGLEHGIVNILVLVQADFTQEQGETLSLKMETEFKKTFGKLINSLKKISDIDSEIILKLEYVLKKRNFLAHSFFRESIYEQASPEGKYRLINKLIDIEKEVKFVNKILSLVQDLLTQQFSNYDVYSDMYIKKIKSGEMDTMTEIAISDFYS